MLKHNSGAKVVILLQIIKNHPSFFVKKQRMRTFVLLKRNFNSLL